MRSKDQILRDIRALTSDESNYATRVLRDDPYTLVTNSVLKKIPDSEIFDGMSYKDIRAAVKDATMTALYNSKLVPISVFGEDTVELGAFYKSLYELFPGAMDVLEALNGRWDDEALHHEWALPDGHTSSVKVMETLHGTLNIEGLEMAYRYKDNMASETSTSLAPNFTHSIDGAVVRYIVMHANFPVSHVHDQIDFHPNHGDKVRELYLEAIKIAAESGLLESFCKEDFGINVSAVVAGMKDSQYALC